MAMGLYNLSITGSVLRMPYQTYVETYTMAPIFTWQNAYAERPYRNAVQAAFNEGEMDVYRQRSTMHGFISAKRDQLWELWEFYAGTAFALPLILMGPILILRSVRNRWMLLSIITTCIVVLSVFAETFVNKHYFAPITSLVILYVLYALRLLRWRDSVLGRFVLALTLGLCLFSLGRSVFDMSLYGRVIDWRQNRTAILRQLQQAPGRHLIIVHYTPQHFVAQEYVYNEADIDNAKVVWARDLGPAANMRLIEYFKDRKAWLLEPDGQSHPMVKPYSLESSY
jgi:hypothetical protein